MKTNAKGAYLFGEDYEGFASFASGAMNLSKAKDFDELPWTDRKTRPRTFMASCAPFDGKFGDYFLVWQKGGARMVRVPKKS